MIQLWIVFICHFNWRAHVVYYTTPYHTTCSKTPIGRNLKTCDCLGSSPFLFTVQPDPHHFFLFLPLWLRDWQRWTDKGKFLYQRPGLDSAPYGPTQGTSNFIPLLLLFFSKIPVAIYVHQSELLPWQHTTSWYQYPFAFNPANWPSADFAAATLYLAFLPFSMVCLIKKKAQL